MQISVIVPVGSREMTIAFNFISKRIAVKRMSWFHEGPCSFRHSPEIFRSEEPPPHPPPQPIAVNRPPYIFCCVSKSVLRQPSRASIIFTCYFLGIYGNRKWLKYSSALMPTSIMVTDFLSPPHFSFPPQIYACCSRTKVDGGKVLCSPFHIPVHQVQSATFRVRLHKRYFPRPIFL